MLTEIEIAAILLSLKVASAALLATLPVALLIALFLARHQGFLAQCLNVLVHLPLVMPPIVTGFLLLILFGNQGWIGRLLAETGISFGFRWTGAALAASIMALPLMVRPIRVAIENVDPGIEQAAGTLGAGRLMVTLTVTLPMAIPGIIAGAITGFAKSLGEFGATITFVSSIPGETETIPLAIHGLLQIPGQDLAALRLCLIAFAIAVAAVIASELAVSAIKQRKA